MPNVEFFQNYRHNLAVQLLSTSDRQERRQRLTDAQDTLNYQLAKYERKAFQKGIDFKSRSIQEQKPYQQETDRRYDKFYMSNESCLYKLFPTIQDKTGAIVSVGSDQGLDLFVNSQAQYLLMVDITKETSLFTRALLELGSVHKKIFGQYPTAEQYHSYFREENNHHVIRLLEDNFDKDDLTDIGMKLTGKHTWLRLLSRPRYSQYLNYKSKLRGDNEQTFSWNSSDENLKRVFEAYDEGRISVLQGDITNSKTNENILEIMGNDGSVDVIYLSNVIDYVISDYSEEERAIKLSNIMKIPSSYESMILTTSKNWSQLIKHKDHKTFDPAIRHQLRRCHYLAMPAGHLVTLLRSSHKFLAEDYLMQPHNSSLVSHSEPGVTFVGN